MALIDDYKEQKAALEKALHLQDMMKKANKILRSSKSKTDQVEELVNDGWTLTEASKIVAPDFMGRTGFPQYKLSSNNDYIKRLQDKVNQLQKRVDAEADTGGSEEYTFMGGRAIANHEVGRYQILFDDVPDSDMRTELKKNGWNWSPSNKAWQRQITENTLWSMKRILPGFQQSGSPAEKTSSKKEDHHYAEDKISSRDFAYVNLSPYPIEKYLKEKTGEEQKLDWLKFVVLDGSAFGADKKVKEYLTNLFPNIPADLFKPSIYTKTYVKEAKVLAAAGFVIGDPRLDEAFKKAWSNAFEKESVEESTATNKPKFKIGDIVNAQTKFGFKEGLKITKVLEYTNGIYYDADGYYDIKESDIIFASTKPSEGTTFEQTIPTKAFTGESVKLKTDYHFAENKGDRHGPTQSAGELKRKYGSNPEQVKELFNTLFYGNDSHWYHLVEDKNGVWSWKAQGSSEQPHKETLKTDLWPDQSEYEKERQRQIDQGLIKSNEEGISILGMTKGKDNPVDKLRASDKDKPIEWHEYKGKEYFFEPHYSRWYYNDVEYGSETEIKNVIDTSEEKSNHDFEKLGLKQLTGSPMDSDEKAKMVDYFEQSKKAASSDTDEETTPISYEEFDKLWRSKKPTDFIFWVGWDIYGYDEFVEIGDGDFKKGLAKFMKENDANLDFQIDDGKTYRIVIDDKSSFTSLGEPAPVPQPHEVVIPAYEITSYIKNESVVIYTIPEHKIRILVPTGVRPRFTEVYYRNAQIKDLKNDKLQKIASFKDATPAELYELLQLVHPCEVLGEELRFEGGTERECTKKQLERTDILRRFEEEGPELFKALGLPTIDGYPYANKWVPFIEPFSIGKRDSKTHLSNNYWHWAERRPLDPDFFQEYIDLYTKIKNDMVTASTKSKDLSFQIDHIERNIQIVRDYMQSLKLELSTDKISLDPSSYPNPYELNRAIEKWIDKNVISMFVNESAMKMDMRSINGKRQFSIEEKIFLKSYSGYGGLSKFGTVDKKANFEFYTPKILVEKMWALAYKNGYSSDGSVLEPAVGTGEFLQYASPTSDVSAWEINVYSAVVCQVLYPFAQVSVSEFERHFIDRNFSIKDKLDYKKKYDLVIGNPPYADFQHNLTRWLEMGEREYTGASNYVDYFISRGIDLVKPGGLLIYVIGAEVMAGGTLWLDSGDSKVKQHLNDVAELVEAYRLPNSVFERTKVTSEIIVFKKK